MSLKRTFLLLVLLAFSQPAFAQHPAARGGGRPAPPAHPGQQHMMPGGGQHQMTPQQHQHMMNQQMWNEQMWFMEMMRSRGGANKRAGVSTQTGGRQQTPSNNGMQPNANRKQNGSNPTQPNQNQAKPNAKQQQEKGAQSPGVLAKPTKQEHEKEAKAKEEAASKKRKEEEKLIHRNETKKGMNASRRPLATDQASIGLLHTALRKMREADHDYAGHRVEAMRHAARALEHLGGSHAFDGQVRSSAGNLPQAQSDRLLREAEGHLRFVESSLSSRTNSLEHHHNARTSVGEAMRELRIALRIN
jgi:hypothetical protein